MPTRSWSFRLFRLFGIDVYLSWFWFLVPVYFIGHTQSFSSALWILLACVALFLIVLIHEFGHQLACRQTGGKTNDIILWPFGGVAYVNSPQRAGAQLWSIAAGPLVNVILIPILSALVFICSHLGWYDSHPDAYDFIQIVWLINIRLLIFNMLPIFPLDGGQILRSLLWFPFGRTNSLFVATIIGFVGITVMILMDLLFLVSPETNFLGLDPIWLGMIIFFLLRSCWNGFKQAQALSRAAKIPRRAGFTCPSCKMSPPTVAYWRCGQCSQPFDIFATVGACPHCAARYDKVQCLDCGTTSTMQDWMLPPAVSVDAQVTKL